MQDKIKELLVKEINENLLNKIDLEIPPSYKLGDYAFPCFILAKEFKKSPVQIAKEISDKLNQFLEQNNFITKVESNGPYVNFFLDKSKIAEKTLKSIFLKKEMFFKKQNNSQKIIIEYSAPNTNKPQHLGHIRNNLTGMAVSNIIETQGYDLIRLNWINDRGIHICKSMLAYQKFGEGKTPKSENIKPDHFVGDFYVKFSKEAEKNPNLEKEAQEMLKKWELGDEKIIALWKKMNSWAFEGFKQTYSKLGCKFDKWFYESEIYQKGKSIIKDNFEKGVLKKDENDNIIADLESFNLGSKVLLRKDGTSIYSTADIALANEKSKFKPVKSIYVVGSEQNYYMDQMFKIFELLGMEDYSKVCKHLSYGMIYLPEGKMKSREGKVVDADDLMQEMIIEAKHEIIKRHPKISNQDLNKRSEIIGLGALKFFILKFDINKDFTYNPKESIAFEGETGPYVQYAYARICSILRKHGLEINEKINYSILNHEEEIKLIKLLSQFPSIVENSANKYKPHLIANYLIKLSQQFNLFYSKCSVINEDKDLTKARIFLIYCVKQIISWGMALLGIQVPERM